jgi:hypothetical protein
MILMPRLITNVCLLVKANLTSTQLGNCAKTGDRPLARIDTWVYGIGYMTGANMLDVATTVINLGLITNNETTVQTGINHFYNQTLITPETGADGIKIDGSYLQHFAQLYTGNYGKDYINSVVAMYLQTDGTAYSAPDVSQQSFKVLLDGTQWMIVSNTHNGTNSSLLWEYSTIGRMVSFVYSDNQASGGVRLNLSQITAATEQWTNASDFQTIVETLQPASTESANQGDQQGVRNFFTSDYLVSRGSGYVSTLKMFSQRTTNSECNNDQNPYGFHLSDGSIFSYIQGDEYLDVFAEWDWNLVPGTTVDYGNTPFGCNTTQWYGNTSFVGSVTGQTSNTANTSVAVMQYLNPMTGALRWEKTYFFFPGFYAVQIGPIYSQSAAPIITTLDQSNLKDDVYINGTKLDAEYSQSSGSVTQIWHNSILYTVPASLSLKINTASHTSGWAKLGISQGEAAQRIFTATLEHPRPPLLASPDQPVTVDSYIAQLNTDEKTQETPVVELDHQETPAKVRAAYADKTMAVAFWTAGHYTSKWGWTIETNQPILLTLDASVLNVADPTQQLKQVNITLTSQTERNAPYQLSVDLPQGSLAGSTVTLSLSD